MRVPCNYYFSCFTKQAAPDIADTAKSKLEGVDWTSLAGIAALLGTGFLAHQGVQRLAGLKPVGGFKDQLEKSILAHNVLLNQNAMSSLAQRASAAESSLRTKNLLLAGSGLTAIAGPALAAALSARLNPPPAHSYPTSSQGKLPQGQPEFPYE